MNKLWGELLLQKIDLWKNFYESLLMRVETFSG